jgi:hypothetical protein
MVSIESKDCELSYLPDDRSVDLKCWQRYAADITVEPYSSYYAEARGGNAADYLIHNPRSDVLYVDVGPHSHDEIAVAVAAVIDKDVFSWDVEVVKAEDMSADWLNTFQSRYKRGGLYLVCVTNYDPYLPLDQRQERDSVIRATTNSIGATAGIHLLVLGCGVPPADRFSDVGEWWYNGPFNPDTDILSYQCSEYHHAYRQPSEFALEVAQLTRVFEDGSVRWEASESYAQDDLSTRWNKLSQLPNPFR